MKGKAVLPALPWLLRMDAVQLTVHRSLGWAGGCRFPPLQVLVCLVLPVTEEAAEVVKGPSVTSHGSDPLQPGCLPL